MARLDWSQCSAVESVPERFKGTWVFRDTRMPVSAVFENLESGASVEEIMEWFHLTRGQLETFWSSPPVVFDVLVTADKNIPYQQNLVGRRPGIVELSTPRWLVVRLHVERVIAAVNAATPGSYGVVDIPSGRKGQIHRSHVPDA